MENKSFYEQSGRALTRDEITHVESALLCPASARCRRNNDDDGYVLYKEPRQPIVLGDNLRYFPRFISEMNTETNQWKYRVGLRALESVAYGELSVEDRRVVISQYWQTYEREGGEAAHYNEEDVRYKLVTPENYSQINVHLSSTQEYEFDGDKASRSFDVKYILTPGPGVRARLLGQLSLRAGLGSFQMNVWRNDLPESVPVDMCRSADNIVDEISALDLALDLREQDYCAVTPDDVGDVIGVLKMLDLISPNDEKRFNQSRQ